MTEPAISFDAPAPGEPICRTPDLRAPCQFAHICTQHIQERQHALNLRGTECRHFVRLGELATRYPSMSR